MTKENTETQDNNTESEETLKEFLFGIVEDDEDGKAKAQRMWDKYKDMTEEEQQAEKERMLADASIEHFKVLSEDITRKLNVAVNDLIIELLETYSMKTIEVSLLSGLQNLFLFNLDMRTGSLNSIEGAEEVIKHLTGRIKDITARNIVNNITKNSSVEATLSSLVRLIQEEEEEEKETD